MLDLNLDTSEKVVSLISGLVAIATGLGIWRWRKNSRQDTGSHASPSGAQTTTQHVQVTVGAPGVTPQQASTSPTAQSSNAEIKRKTNVLFIDDDRGFKIVSVLKKMGWEHTRLITDVSQLEQPALLEAHVVFVDVQGVGKLMQYSDEGLGLALAIKRRYPSKRVVIYSAEVTGERFHEALNEADYSLPKTAEPIRFEDTIFRVLNK